MKTTTLIRYGVILSLILMVSAWTLIVYMDQFMGYNVTIKGYMILLVFSIFTLAKLHIVWDLNVLYEKEERHGNQ